MGKSLLTVQFMLCELHKAVPAMKSHAHYVRDFSNGLQVVVQMHVVGPYCRVWMACQPKDAKIFDDFVLQATRKGYDLEIDDEDGIPSAFVALKA